MNESLSEFPTLTAPTVEMFLKGFIGVVTTPITLYQPGRVKCQGISWRAKLYEPNCQTTLLAGQPVIVIGRENLTFIVTPLHCPLQEQDANDSHAWPAQLDFTLFFNLILEEELEISSRHTVQNKTDIDTEKAGIISKFNTEKNKESGKEEKNLLFKKTVIDVVDSEKESNKIISNFESDFNAIDLQIRKKQAQVEQLKNDARQGLSELAKVVEEL